MAKKSTKKRTPKAAKAPVSRSAGNTQNAMDVKKKASEILEARNSELFKLLLDSSEIIRAASFNEVQIHLQKETQEKLESDRKSLVAELVALKKTNAEQRHKVDALSKESKKILAENTSFQKKVDKLSRDADKLKDRREKLEKDVATLEKRSATLREDVERLQIIRKEYMDRISKFREMREDLIR